MPWRAESPPTGSKCWSRLARANDLLLYTDQAEGSRNSSCATQNCLQQSLGFGIVLLGSWGLNFPEVTYTAASVGVSWLSVCSDKAPGVFEGGASLTHQSTVHAQLHLCTVLAKAQQSEHFDPRLVLFWLVSKVPNFRLSGETDCIFRLPQAFQFVHLFFSFSGLIFIGSSHTPVSKGFSIVTGLSRVSQGGATAVSASLP